VPDVAADAENVVESRSEEPKDDTAKKVSKDEKVPVDSLPDINDDGEKIIRKADLDAILLFQKILRILCNAPHASAFSPPKRPLHLTNSYTRE
jgi:hypothetical protein